MPVDYNCRRDYNYDNDYDKEGEEKRRKAAGHTVEGRRNFQLVLVTVKMARVLGLVVAVVERERGKVSGSLAVCCGWCLGRAWTRRALCLCAARRGERCGVGDRPHA